eukprot:310872-Amphidinium_carterae.1
MVSHSSEGVGGGGVANAVVKLCGEEVNIGPHSCVGVNWFGVNWFGGSGVVADVWVCRSMQGTGHRVRV